MDTADPSVNDFDNENEVIDPEKIVAEAQASFSLSDRLKGITHRARTVLIFTDSQAVDEYSKLNEECQSLADAASRLDVKKAEEAARHETLIDAFNAAEEKMLEAKKTMLDAALTVQLQSYPNIVAKIARRDGRKKFTDPVSNQIPEERQMEYAEFIDLYLLGSAIVGVTDTQGNKMEVPADRFELGKMLSDMLPPTQWDRLYRNFADLVLTDQIGRSATDDPGF